MRETSGNIADLRALNLHKIPGMIDFENAPIARTHPCDERDRLDWSIMIAVANLTGLLWKIVRVKVNNGPSEQIDALQAEGKSLSASIECLLIQWKAHRTSHGCYH